MSQVSAVNACDDIGNAVKWMLKGRVYAQGFVKHLPYTTQDLRLKKVTPQQVANDLNSLYITNRKSYKGYGGMGVDEDSLADLSVYVTDLALPLKMFTNAGLHKEKLIEGIKEEFREHFVSSYVKRSEKLPDISFPELVKTSVDEVCEEWAGWLDTKLFRGKKGMFLKKCGLYGVPPRRYEEPNMPVHKVMYFIESGYKEFGTNPRLKSEILSAAQEVVGGIIYDFKKTCWQCKMTSETSLTVCSGCGIARYCSRACQVCFIFSYLIILV